MAGHTLDIISIMNSFINLALDQVLIKDMSDLIDFDLLKTEFNSLKFRKNTENNISEDYNFLDRERLLTTKQVLETECENYLRYGQHVHAFDHLRITKSWGNITNTGQSHHKHNHPFSIVSGVLYLDDNPANLDLFLQTTTRELPYFLWQKDAYIPLHFMLGNQNNLKNHIVLFVSSTMHYVDTNKETADRRSISWNTFWQGWAGESESPLTSMVF